MSTKTSSAIKDDGAHFVIVPATRQVTVPASHKAIGAVGDHLSEQLTFECPKVIDGYDIPMCARRYVTWLNVNGEIGHDELKNVKTEGDKVFFTWTIRDRLTAAKGLVQFSIHFEDLAEDGETIKYRWGTATCKSCEILDSINASLGAYAAVYVSGDTLVIADYTPVAGDALALETPGIVPEGTLVITENGVHDVGLYAQAKVSVGAETPTITVGEDGTITASANGVESTHQITSADCADLRPSNILKGANVLGVSGAFDADTVPVTVQVSGVTDVSNPVVKIYYPIKNASGFSNTPVQILNNGSKQVDVCRGLVLVIVPPAGDHLNASVTGGWVMNSPRTMASDEPIVVGIHSAATAVTVNVYRVTAQ